MLVNYLLISSGEYEPGGGTFYICIEKGGDVVGYARKESMLTPFGFT